MKDLTIKSIRGKIASAVISINGKEYEVNSSFSILSKIYNEMYDTDLSFADIVQKYINQTNDKTSLEKIAKALEEKKVKWWYNKVWKTGAQ